MNASNTSQKRSVYSVLITVLVVGVAITLYQTHTSAQSAVDSGIRFVSQEFLNPPESGTVTSATSRFVQEEKVDWNTATHRAGRPLSKPKTLPDGFLLNRVDWYPFGAQDGGDRVLTTYTSPDGVYSLFLMETIITPTPYTEVLLKDKVVKDVTQNGVHYMAYYAGNSLNVTWANNTSRYRLWGNLNPDQLMNIATTVDNH